MTRTNDLQAAYDVADQRAHEARTALKVAQEERARAADALALSRVPADVLEHMERVRQAGKLTVAEQAERDEAQAVYDAALADEDGPKVALSKLLRGIDPSDGSKPDPRAKRDTARDDRIKAAKREVEQELGRLQTISADARRQLRGITHRQDKARQQRRAAVKEAHRSSRRNSVGSTNRAAFRASGGSGA